MLRKRQVKEPGDTPFLPGQIVDRFTFQRANETVRELIRSGKKIKYVDPITGENVERDPKEATATWILLGITEASLATDSFLSAASFQKTTRVLTEAAVRGKKDQLIGLKENVIIGRLDPGRYGRQAIPRRGGRRAARPELGRAVAHCSRGSGRSGLGDGLGALIVPVSGRHGCRRRLRRSLSQNQRGTGLGSCPFFICAWALPLARR